MLIASLGIFALSATLFILLRTQQYLAVDGALRCLWVYWLGHPTAGGNNHLLYFVNVYVWTKMLSIAGCDLWKLVRFRAVSSLDERACGCWIDLDLMAPF
jgi:hypothetical protein